MRIQDFTDQLIYETFFEKIFMMMNQPESIKSNCLHILTPCFGLFHNSHKCTTFRLSSPTETLIKDTHYRNRILSFNDIFNPYSDAPKDYDTVVKTINLIEEGMNNYKTDSLFLQDQSEVDWNVMNSFQEQRDELTIHDAPYLFFYLEAYSQQRANFLKMLFFESLSNLLLFERIKQFDFSIITKFCTEIATIQKGDEYKIPLYVKTTKLLLLMLGDFVNNIRLLKEGSKTPIVEGEDHPFQQGFDNQMLQKIIDHVSSFLEDVELC